VEKITKNTIPPFKIFFPYNQNDVQ